MISKKDFIEIEFTARIKDGNVFDTNIKSDAEKAGLKIDAKPFVLAIGYDMIIKGLDEDFEGKEIDKKYTIEITPEKAFGKRNPQLIKMSSVNAFKEQKINPERGMQLSLDGKIVTILSASGGRVLIDYNNPLAGKTVVYEYKINRKVTEQKEKINALQEFFFRKKFPFTIKEKTITFQCPKGADQFIKFFEKQFKDILELDVMAEVVEEKKIEEKKSEEKKE